MNGVHDLGGTEGLGRVAPTKEGEEPVFYSDWERAVFAMLRLVHSLSLIHPPGIRRRRPSLSTPL